MCDSRCISNGIVAGVVAGIVFTFFLILMDNLTHLPTKIGGLMIHFIVSIIAGVIFAFILGWLIHSWWSASFLGLLFGSLLWIAGPMTLLPSLTTGTALFSQWNFAGIQANTPLLIGHLIYGLVLGLSYYFLKKGKLHKLKKPRI
ncbi:MULTISPECIES: hypothetical protein [Legionella]|uniref:Transmembrane protein n=1 Tax=Legionella drozanskii LLAP-1 TaxID=1212489 RepID=A0A0W0SW63_9GAMM|nr:MULTISPECIES: hypothetical protein [Legionella]KTC87579.1 hypothetical protein Ldro_1198 [Legionella drozanskii LLAP-1]PJE11392.1 MAG: hypothetical protein CK430_08970 [Legionella sp.]